jgi:hypothetical protein
LIKFLLSDPQFFVSHHHASNEKRIIYHKQWPDMAKREKSSGFGMIQKDIRDPAEARLAKQFPDLQDLFISINELH